MTECPTCRRPLHLNGNARLTADAVREIREAYAAGRESQGALAIRFRVEQATISQIVTGHSWRWVGGPTGAPRVSFRRAVVVHAPGRSSRTACSARSARVPVAKRLEDVTCRTCIRRIRSRRIRSRRLVGAVQCDGD